MGDLKNVDVEKQVEILQKFIDQQVEELKVKAVEVQKIAVANLIAMKKQAIVLANQAYKAAFDFVDQTKIVDTQKLIKEVQAKIAYLKANYKKIANDMVETVQKTVKPIIANIKAEIEKIIATYKPKVIAAIKEYEALFNKNKAIAIKKFNELKSTAIKMMNEYKVKATAAFNQYKTQGMKVYNQAKTQVVEMIKKIQAVIMKYKKEAH